MVTTDRNDADRVHAKGLLSRWIAAGDALGRVAAELLALIEDARRIHSECGWTRSQSRWREDWYVAARSCGEVFDGIYSAYFDLRDRTLAAFGGPPPSADPIRTAIDVFYRGLDPVTRAARRCEIILNAHEAADAFSAPADPKREIDAYLRGIGVHYVGAESWIALFEALEKALAAPLPDALVDTSAPELRPVREAIAAATCRTGKQNRVHYGKRDTSLGVRDQADPGIDQRAASRFARGGWKRPGQVEIHTKDKLDKKNALDRIPSPSPSPFEWIEIVEAVSERQAKLDRKTARIVAAAAPKDTAEAAVLANHDAGMSWTAACRAAGVDPSIGTRLRKRISRGKSA